MRREPESPACPECGSTHMWRDEVDVGVGIMYGPWGCDNCHWFEGRDDPKLSNNDKIQESDDEVF